MDFLLKNNALYGVSFGILSALLSGCFPSGLETQDLSNLPQVDGSGNLVGPASQPQAAKFIFRQSNPSGSFNAPAAGGTVPGAGSGHPAIRVFNADGSLMADGGPSDEDWPQWITRMEIGISGANNTAATNADCARFATAADAAAVCDFDLDATADQPCGAPSGLFRVSERDCVVGGAATIRTGDGTSSDGVYIRVALNRSTDYLESGENLLVVFEYAASALNPAPSNPTQCFVGGIFSPTNTNCSDMSWQLYLKAASSSLVQPYMLFVPPAFASVDTTNNRGGSGVSTKQFIVPLASDSTITEFQLSRIRAIPIGAPNFNTACVQNSALCVGMVFYSMTIFRM